MNTKFTIDKEKYAVIHLNEEVKIDSFKMKNIKDHQVDGLLKFSLMDDTEGKKIYYNRTSFISLSQYTKTRMLNQVEGLSIYNQVIEIIKETKKQDFYAELILNFDYVYIHAQTNRIHMIYLPIELQEDNLNKDIEDFFNRLVSKVYSFNKQDLLQSHNVFKQYINDFYRISEEDKEAYNNNEDAISRRIKEENKKIDAYKKREEEQFVEEVCSTKEEISIKQSTEIKEAESKEIDEYHKGRDKVQANENEECTEETIDNKSIKQDFLYEAYLIKGVDPVEDIKVINHTPFILGRNPSKADYIISQLSINDTHAKIFEEDRKYFIMDMGSDIGTVVNNRRIRQLEPYEIKNDTQIKIGDNEFVFVLDEVMAIN